MYHETLNKDARKLANKTNKLVSWADGPSGSYTLHIAFKCRHKKTVYMYK